MNRISRAATFAALVLSATVVNADDAFLKLDGIQGECPDPAHLAEICVLTYSYGVNRPVTPSTRANFQDVTVSAYTSKALPPLFEYAAAGTHIPKAVLTVRKRVPNTAPFEYLKITLADVQVTAVAAAMSGTSRQLDEYSFNYRTITIEYTEAKSDGTPGNKTRTCWDVVANARC